jgi:MFS family permease
MTQSLQASPPSSPAIAAFDGPQGWRQGLAYGLMGLPLAFVALPLYVIWPNHYAREMGVSLSALGLLLLAVRLGDALIDPWLGRVLDQYGRTKEKYKKTIVHLSLWGALLLLGSVYALFAPSYGLVGLGGHGLGRCEFELFGLDHRPSRMGCPLRGGYSPTQPCRRVA